MTSTTEGDFELLDEIDESWMCVLCGTPAFPTMQIPCGHRICHKCSDSIDEQHPKICPMGEEDCGPIEETVPDKFVNKKLRACRVRCRHCGWQGILRHFEAHMSECKKAYINCSNEGCEELFRRDEKENHKENCLYELQECPNCSMSIKRKELQEHLRFQCKKGATHCPHCEEDQITSDSLDKHKEVCEYRELRCTVPGCGQQFTTRTEYDEHKGNDSIHRNLIWKKFQQLSTLINTVENRLKSNEVGVLTVEEKVSSALQSLDSEKQSIELRRLVLHEVEESRQQDQRERSRELDDLKKRMNALELEVRNLKKIRQGDADTLRSITPPATSSSNFSPSVDPTILPAFDSELIWVVEDAQRKRQEIKNGLRLASLYSTPFYTSRFGYKMCGRLYLNGDGTGRDTHISLFFAVMKGEYDAVQKWPFTEEIRLYLLTQDGSPENIRETFHPDTNSTSYRKPSSRINVASGCPRFVLQTLAFSDRFLKDGSLVFKISVGPRR